MARIENGHLIFSFVTRDQYQYEDAISLIELKKALGEIQADEDKVVKVANESGLKTSP